MATFVYRFPRTCAFNRDRAVLLLVQIMADNTRKEYTLAQIQSRVEDFSRSYRQMCVMRGNESGSSFSAEESASGLLELETNLPSVIQRGICQGYIVKREVR